MPLGIGEIRRGVERDLPALARLGLYWTFATVREFQDEQQERDGKMSAFETFESWVSRRHVAAWGAAALLFASSAARAAEVSLATLEPTKASGQPRVVRIDQAKTLASLEAELSSLPPSKRGFPGW